MQGNDPLYLQMRAYLLELIERNRQVPFYRLPSENQLAMKFGASRISAKHALDMLRDEGLICRQQGRGSYIAPIPAEDAAQAPNREAMALIVPFTRTIFMSDLMDGLREALNEQSLDLVTFVTDNDQEQEMTYLRQAQERFKGILLFPCTLARYHEEVLRLVLNRFPLVQIDRYLLGLNLSCVSCDHKMATYRAVKFLREKGHRRIGFVGHMKDHASSVALRLKGFDLATQETDPGYPQSFKLNVADTLDGFADAFAAYMQAMRPTAIISSSHLHAPAIIAVLRQLGMDRQVQLMLYDNEFQIARDFLAYPLFIIDQQPHLIGRAAAGLVNRLAFQGGQPENILVPEKIIAL